MVTKIVIYCIHSNKVTPSESNTPVLIQSVIGTKWKNKNKIVTLQKGQINVKVKTKRSCTQLYHPS